MTEPQNQNIAAPKPKSKNPCLLIGIIVVAVIIFLVIAGYFGLAWILRKLNQNLPSYTSSPSEQAKVETGIVDETLIDSWDTGCLIPDSESPWAERHTFVIKSDGAAEHKRYSGENCSSLTQDHDDKITYLIPSRGKINLTYTSGIAAGSTSHDIYEISGSALKFGHGFCNCISTEGKYGASESDRFTKLNDFLVYIRQ